MAIFLFAGQFIGFDSFVRFDRLNGLTFGCSGSGTGSDSVGLGFHRFVGVQSDLLRVNPVVNSPETLILKGL